jgi:hypothetical protein
MYSREDVELALEGLAEGMSVREVSEMVGCRGSTVRDWAAGRLPRSCTGAPPRGRMAPLPGTSFERKSHRFLSSIRSGPAQPF